ncbi:MAG: hypothetical protein ACYDCL_14335 [Myxococcales bacterium]
MIPVSTIVLFGFLAAAPAAGGLGQLRQQRDTAQAELQRLGALIAAKKAVLPAGSEPGGELLELLRTSATLSARVEALQREVAAIESGLRAAPVPAAVPVEARAAEGDDARALREKADFLQDREDALRKRIAGVDRRLETLGRERALARRVSEFAREQDLFDEDDRRIAATRSEYTTPSPAGLAATASLNTPSVAGRTGAAGGANGGGGGGAVGSTPGQTDNGLGSPSVGSSAPAAPPPGVTESPSLSRQTVSGTRPEDWQSANPDDDDSLESLQAQRDALSREADELRRAAQALEKSAAERR